ncbi:hypothetical protein [Arthrobacter sp. lap29]|uniref:hypothetical protein n=1 Tax=Arthrobacter sp. lap29 TaxID=3056122 RepID=UPI0028F6FA4B|nr:hypothetical protein [Arthrobacter sp. lap29]
MLNYLPETPIFVVNGSNANIKITEPVDIHIADKLFQLRGFSHPSGGASAADLNGISIVIFGASHGIGLELANLLTKAGAHVHGFSRSSTGTDIAHREDKPQRWIRPSPPAAT